MSFSVSKMAPTLVAPSEPTPSGNLPLSFMDRAPALRFFVEALFVFERGNEPAKIIREALANTLVPYYPMAGRFVTDTDDSEKQVACTGEGMWFVEATTNCTLKDVDFFVQQPLAIPKEQLIPYPPPETDPNAVPFMIQVTEFTCGGFTVVFKGNHVMSDAIGAAEFIKAIGEKSRGLAELTSRPIWCREAIPKPPNLHHAVQLTQSATLQNSEFVHYTMDIPQDTINQLQKDFLQETGQRCSGFDVMTAKLWQCRTRAIDLPPDSDVTLSFPANIRHELRNELPSVGSYYGNCTFPLVIKARSAKVANASLAEIVALIREVKGTLPAKCARFLKGETDENDDLLTLTYGATNLTDMRRVGYYETDFGRGTPMHVLPLIDNPINLSLFLNPPAPEKGLRLKTHCVMKEHLKAFQDELRKMT